MSSAAFVKMIEAYRDTLGKACPRRDTVAVVKVFRACRDHDATTQEQVRLTTGCLAGNLSKIVKDAREMGWIRTADTRGADGTKGLSLTKKGRAVLDDFESRCAAACSDAAKAAPRAKPKTSRRSRIEEGKKHTLSFFDDRGRNETPHEPPGSD